MYHQNDLRTAIDSLLDIVYSLNSNQTESSLEELSELIERWDIQELDDVLENYNIGSIGELESFLQTVGFVLEVIFPEIDLILDNEALDKIENAAIRLDEDGFVGFGVYEDD